MFVKIVRLLKCLKSKHKNNNKTLKLYKLSWHHLRSILIKNLKLKLSPMENTKER